MLGQSQLAAVFLFFKGIFILQERVGRRLKGLRVLNSYWVGQVRGNFKDHLSLFMQRCL